VRKRVVKANYRVERPTGDLREVTHVRREELEMEAPFGRFVAGTLDRRTTEVAAGDGMSALREP